MPRRLLVGLGLLGLVTGYAVTGSPAAAGATGVSGVRVAAVTGSGFTVTADPIGSGWRYRLYSSTDRHDLTRGRLGRARYRSRWVSLPKLALSRLPYTTKPYWYRLEARKGHSSRVGTVSSVGLVPAVPSALAARTGLGSGTYLTWSAGAVTGFDVQQATDAAFTQDLVTYRLRGNGHQLTPVALRLTTIYHFRIRAVNNGTTSAYSTETTAVAAAADQPVRAMTYNLLHREADGTAPNGRRVAHWMPDRRDASARLVAMAAPDVLAVQEAGSWIGGRCTGSSRNQRRTRQVDTFLAALRRVQPGGHDYALAPTEIPPCLVQDGRSWFRAGVYVIYDASRFAAAATGGVWELPLTGSVHRYAAFQLLRARDSGATFLFVSTHFCVWEGRRGDAIRRAEMQSLLSHARAYAAKHGHVPIVYGGDYNSNARHPLDGPGVTAHQAGVADALDVAATRADDRYSSANGYRPRPPVGGLPIDHVFVEPGVGVSAWSQELRLAHGSWAGVLPSDHNPVIAELQVPYLPPYDATRAQPPATVTDAGGLRSSRSPAV